MILQAYAAALLIIVGSTLLGHAICVAAGGSDRWWAAPAVGFAALMIVADVAIKLPGRSVTASAVVGFAVAGAVGFLWRRRVLPMQPSDVAIIIVALIAASVPFIASGRVGVPGVSELNDTANHLVFAEGLRSSAMAKLWPLPAGYPLGPHSVVAVIGTATGMPLDRALTGLLLAIVPITALVAQHAVSDQVLWRRAVVALTCALGYLLASYYAEGAFKETIMAGLLLAFVLHVEQVQSRWARKNAVARWRNMVPVVLLVGGAVYTYSYLGLAWPAVSTVIWLVAEMARRPAGLSGLVSRRNLSSIAPWAAGTVVLLAVILAPIAGQAISFFKVFGLTPATVGTISAPLANLIGPLSPYEALDLWWSADFRRVPANGFHAGELAAFALAVLVFGVIWSVRRRRLLMPATVVGCALIWWLAQRSGSPYVAAKALVISVPVVTAMGLRALLTRFEGSRSARVMAVSIAAIFCLAAAYSSYQELRNVPVQAPEASLELAAFSHTIGDSAVLFLGDDDYVPWQLRPAAVTSLSRNGISLSAATTRATKPWVSGQALDFDSVDPADLDRFRFVVTSDSAYASQPPANFRLRKAARLYNLWERVGPTTPREILEPSGAPGAILNCSTPTGRRVSTERGQASVMTPPITAPGSALLPGGSGVASLALPPGRWEISIQYTSSTAVQLGIESSHWTMPAYLGRMGPFFAAGTVSGHGRASPLLLRIASQRPSVLTGSGGNLFTAVPVIAATRVPNTRRLVRLRQACGQYIDWYRLR